MRLSADEADPGKKYNFLSTILRPRLWLAKSHPPATKPRSTLFGQGGRMDIMKGAINSER